MDRYQKIVLRVKGLNFELALQYIPPAFKLVPFKDSVYQRAPKTMEELRERVTDEIRVEEMKQSYKRENQEAKGEKADSKRCDNHSGKLGGAKQREPPRGPRFQQYTPLNAPHARILQVAFSLDARLSS